MSSPALTFQLVAPDELPLGVEAQGPSDDAVRGAWSCQLARPRPRYRASRNGSPGVGVRHARKREVVHLVGHGVDLPEFEPEHCCFRSHGSTATRPHPPSARTASVSRSSGISTMASWSGVGWAEPFALDGDGAAVGAVHGRAVAIPAVVVSGDPGVGSMIAYLPGPGARARWPGLTTWTVRGDSRPVNESTGIFRLWNNGGTSTSDR